VLNIEEVSGLLQLLREPARTAAFLAVMTGLRVGELLALKWGAIGFEKGVHLKWPKSASACYQQGDTLLSVSLESGPLPRQDWS